MKKALGERLRELRNEKDVSLREAGKVIGVTAMHLSDMECGRRYPSEKVLQSIAVYYGVDISELKDCDTRPPVDEIKRVSSSHPAVGFAFRTVMEEFKKGDITPEQLAERLKGSDK
jgi:transcriptional regulator with XRE-family HTH domain